jgi:RNA polymerase sigma-70 factor (ECF subfamily)
MYLAKNTGLNLIGILLIQYCISKIPIKLRPVFFAKYMEERDAEEICKEFGISTSNYWVMLHRSKLLMRACLEKTYYGKK